MILLLLIEVYIYVYQCRKLLEPAESMTDADA